MDNQQIFAALIKASNDRGKMRGFLSGLKDEMKRDDRFFSDKKIADRIEQILSEVEDEKI
jgi:hypothetical protein